MTAPHPLRARLPGLLLDTALLLALALFCARLLAPLEAARDLTLWDEADYLRRALLLPQRGLPAPEWGPLHSLFYFALWQLVPDPVALHDAGYRLLAALPTLGLYLCARRAGVPRALGLLGACLFLVSAAPHIAPRPTLLALVLVLAGLWVALGRAGLAGAAAALGLSLLLASFARPELFAAFLLCSAVLAFALVQSVRRGERRGPSRTGLGYVAAALALVAVLGNPMADRTGRRLYAFCQHFAVGEVARAGLPFEPWGQCTAVLQRSFGPVKSVREAARANPRAFLTHVRENLRRYPAASVELFLRGPTHPSVLAAQPHPWPLARRAHALLLALAAAGLAALLVRAALRGRSALRDGVHSAGVQRCGLALLAVLLPSALSSVLLHPREHYLVLQGVLLPLFLLALASACAALREVRGAQVLPGALALALLLAAPGLGPTMPGTPPVHRRAVAALREATAGMPGPLPLLEAQGGYDVYVGGQVTQVAAWQRRAGEPFTDFLERRGVRLVVLEPKLTHHALLVGDPEFRAFVADPAAFGFRTQALGDTGMVLAVREERRGGSPVERASRKSGASPGMRSGHPSP